MRCTMLVRSFSLGSFAAAVTGFAWIAACATGCSGVVETDTTSSTETTSGAGGAGRAGGTSSVTTSTTSTSSTGTMGGGGAVSFSGTVVRSPQGTLLSGAEVCVLDHPEMPCALSDSQGSFSLLLPAGAETGVTLSKAGYGGVLVPLVTSDQDQEGWTIGVPTTGLLSNYYGDAGATYPDAGKGFLLVVAHDGATDQYLAGVNMALMPVSGAGPFYSDSGGVPDAALTSTSSAGLARFSSIDPGEIEVVLSPDTFSCDTNFGGWPSANVNSVRVPVVPDLETHVGLRCF